MILLFFLSFPYCFVLVCVFIFSHANGMTPGEAGVGSLSQLRLKYLHCWVNRHQMLSKYFCFPGDEAMQNEGIL